MRSPTAQRDDAGFLQRLGALRPQRDALGIGYHPEPDLDWGQAQGGQ